MPPESFEDEIAKLRALRSKLTSMTSSDELVLHLHEIREAIDYAILMLMSPRSRDTQLMEAIATLLLAVSRTKGPTSEIRRWWVSDYKGFDKAMDLFTQLYGYVHTQELK